MRKMKDSGVEWIGEVPESWDIYRLKSVASNATEPMPEEPSLSIPLENIEPWTGKLINGEKSEKNDGCSKGFRKGDVLFSKLRPYLAKAVYATDAGACSGEILVLRPEKIDPRYLAKLLLSSSAIDEINCMNFGAKMPRAEWNLVCNLRLPLPSFEEQHQIADYLDERCAAIDEDVAKRREVIGKLKEYKKSLIAHAVTKGLDPTAEMKDSGVEWIGAVPANWNVSPVWSVLKQRKESNEHGNQTFILSVVKDKGVIPYSQKGNVGNKAKEDLSGYMIARKGDIVFNSMNVIIGSVGLSDFDGAISPAYYAVYPASDSICIRYYDYIFQTRQFQYALRLIANGILEIRLKVNYRDFSHQKLPVPDCGVQEEIVTYLDERTAAIDEAIARQEQLIDKLGEYRKSIIHHAVTGKIDCTEG